MDLSIVIPIFNEAQNIPLLHKALKETLDKLSLKYEILFVDDGSTDGTFEALKNIVSSDKDSKLIQLARRSGQTAALSAGFELAKGAITITLDADLQNDPKDIPQLLAKLSEGYDVVSGWRKNRKDAWLTKTLPSQIANNIISRSTGVRLHDYGCTLKAYRTEFLKQIRLYGEMHRFLPVYLQWRGAKITEVPVSHHPRIHGKTKYNLSKTLGVVLDLLTVKFLESFSTKPIHVFGGWGILFCFSGFIIGIITLIQKYAYQVWVHNNPLLLLAVFLFILGMQCIMMGLLAELGIRTYHESQQKKPYFIKQVIGS
jgi:glycosyltransferase involved in cell wall biosynthesis